VVLDGTWRDDGTFLPKERLALEFAERATVTPPTVDEALITELGEHFEPAAIVEMAATVAFENYRARFNCALGIESNSLYQPD
jgi:alkylhydroperoxidase family enzyme